MYSSFGKPFVQFLLPIFGYFQNSILVTVTTSVLFAQALSDGCLLLFSSYLILPSCLVHPIILLSLVLELLFEQPSLNQALRLSFVQVFLCYLSTCSVMEIIANKSSRR